MNGILLLDKEQSWTSNDAVVKLKGILRQGGGLGRLPLTVRSMSGNDYSGSGASGGGPKAARLYKLSEAVKSSLFFRKTYGLVFFCYNK